VFYHDYVVNY